MAMRITTKMMQNRSLNNLNTNKALQEKLTTQLSTMKKITRPSDDPVIAIRSLKLNASLDKIDQYYEKNAKDAASWLQLTESAIKTTTDILTGMRTYIDQAAHGPLEASDRAAILENLSNFQFEIYATGNADSDGRSIFTGYRTNTPLTFKEDKADETYKITEQWNNSCLDVETFVKTGDLEEINEGNFTTKTTTEYAVDNYQVARIRMAYNNLDIDTTANPPTADVALQTVDTDGNVTDYTVTDYFNGATDEAYMTAVNNPDAIVYVAETGELLLGKNVQAELAELSMETEIRVTYEKTDWKKDDLDPIHYFYTERTMPNGAGTKTLVYNEDKLKDPTSQNAQQIIEYDIGNNQTIRVNTTADEIFTHDIGRDVGEVVTMLEEYQELLDVQETVKGMIESGKYDGEELKKLEEHFAGLGKAATMAKDKVQKTCEGLLTTFDGYLKQAALAQTDCGSRESRLNLIQNRLSAQQTNFQELVSENEDADVTDLAIQLSSVELTYEAALSSISYVMQTSLLDFL